MGIKLIPQLSTSDTERFFVALESIPSNYPRIRKFWGLIINSGKVTFLSGGGMLTKPSTQYPIGL